jgi:hypothetical protein
MSPFAFLAALLNALLYFRAFSRSSVNSLLEDVQRMTPSGSERPE